MHLTITEKSNRIEFKSEYPKITGSIQLFSEINQYIKTELINCFGKCWEYKINVIPLKGIIGYKIFQPADGNYIIICSITNEIETIRDLQPFILNIELDPEITTLISPDGLTSATLSKESYLFIAGGIPKSEYVFNTGWISQDKGSGIVKNFLSSSRVQIEPLLEYGVPIKFAESEFFVIQFGTNINSILEEYADLIKKYYQISLPPIPQAGYCTWYASYHPGAADEKSMAKLAVFADEHHLQDYGFEVLQIDDMWQTGPSRRRSWGKPPITLNKRTKADSGPWSDFTTHRKFGFYPHGMKAIAEKFKQHHLKAGIWLMPFAWDPLSKPLKNHHDWFVKKVDGKIYQVFWAGWCLDMTNPEAQEFLISAIKRITYDWGYEYLKMDGLWSGMATKIRYPDPKYGPDDIGDALFYNKSKTNIEAYRDGLKLVRKCAKPGTFLLGCNVAQNFRTLGGSMGLLDAMRIGRDVGAKWDAIIPCIEMSSRLYFLHGRVWYNDPDCLMLRRPLTIEQAQAWASWIVMTGELNIVSEWLPRLSEDRLNIFLRSIPNTNLVGKPIDLLENDPARIWFLSQPRSNTLPQQDVIGFFNIHGNQPIKFDIPLKDIALAESPTGEYIGYDYWNEEWMEIVDHNLEVIIPPTACRIIAIKPIRDYPQIISTSRHISQGIVDLVEEKWNPQTKVLSGKSKIVIQDNYVLNIYAPNHNLKDIRVHSDAKVFTTKLQEKSKLSVVIIGEKTGIITWELQFE